MQHDPTSLEPETKVDRPIEVSYLWDLHEYDSACEADAIARGSYRSLFFLMFPFVLLSVGLGLDLLIRQDRWDGLFLVAFGGAGSIGTSKWAIRYMRRKSYHEAGVLLQPGKKVTFLIDESGIRRFADGSKSWLAWELMPEVREYPTGFHVMNPAPPYWLPRHAFRDDEDRDEFRDLARCKTAKYLQFGGVTKIKS